MKDCKTPQQKHRNCVIDLHETIIVTITLMTPF